MSRFFADLDQTLENTIGERKQVIRIAVCSSFGPAWLARRLSDFRDHYPSIEVELRMFANEPLQTETIADVFVTADEVEPGFDTIPLFEETLVAVVGPAAQLDDRGMPRQFITTDIERHQLAEDWREFGALTGRDYLGAAPNGLMRCTHYLMALALAQAGVGAALVPDFLAADALAQGGLKLLRPEKLPAGRLYKLCYKSARAREPMVKAVANWMKAQARDGTPTSRRLSLVTETATRKTTR